MKIKLTLAKGDTIAAISTPLGEGGIGIVRLSGKKALTIANKLFKGRNGATPSKLPSYTIHYGHIIRNKEILDEVILSIMRKPKSYTREDVVEINCHGGILPLRKTLEAVLECGARLAEPGEFTKRAFLNGRIDLAQAEAVINIVEAKTELALKSAMSQLKGAFSKTVKELKDETLELLTLFEAELDFPEEKIDIAKKGKFINKIKKLVSETDKLIRQSREGKILRDGVLVLLIGKANVGKSTLLNRLVGKERAIVTHIPGTTRDIIEEWINIEGIPVKIVDTAGFKKIENIIDKKAQEKVEEYLANANLVLFMVDGTKSLSSQDKEIAKIIKEKKMLCLINKVDLLVRPDVLSGQTCGLEKISKNKLKSLIGNKKVLEISALKGKGINAIKKYIKDSVFTGGVSAGESTIMVNARSRESLKDAYNGLLKGFDAITEGLSEEFVAVDLKESLESFKKILGETLEEDILDRIFQRFCIGK
ncbi:tRNA uridine-5-carboxymethylaminomethyl(34) synthesis GTPase MnmE [bacterium]|nr:tRNA uridine-5-carboxymethylaminomethyl(34) synthesis GTPase MnmE [bacterium]